MFGSKIFALCLICFSQVIFSSHLISNPVTITSKFFLIIANIWVFLGILRARSLNSPFLLFPFGFSSAPYIFSELVRPIVNYWRGLGRRVITFLDDGIGGSPDYASCLVLSRLCRSDLDSAGFFMNLQKSLWEPSQVGSWLGSWLGFHLDFSLNFIAVPLPKILKLQDSISRILALRFVNARI